MWLNVFLWILYFIALYFAIFLLSIFVFEPDSKPKKLAHFPLVSVIIPAWNEEKDIRETVESAKTLNYPKLQIIAVDHGSDDNTGKILDSIQGIKVLHIKRKHSDNKAVAFNAGLKHATGEFVACLDADSSVHPEALNCMLPYFMESEKIAVVTPMMLVKEPKNLLQRLQKYEYITSLFIKRLTSHINCIYVAPGPFSVYRTNILKELGGFDENAIAEDMEIVYRIQKNQYLARQCLNGGYSYALAPRTLSSLFKQRKRWYGGSLSNLYKYKELTMNRQYGDFGFFHMPRSLLGILTVFTTLGLFAYFVLIPVLRKIYDLYLIRFEVMPYVSSYNIAVDIFDLKNTHGMFVVLILMLISLFFFVYALSTAGEKLNKKDIPTLIIFLTVYPFLLSCMYLAVVVKKAFGGKFVWHKMER
ncbi:MAG TPA: glycosyltransferase [Nanoarchaeota archaeon]|nr:glycosyltransferase [Nanoarchaeota archaeon]